MLLLFMLVLAMLHPPQKNRNSKVDFRKTAQVIITNEPPKYTCNDLKRDSVLNNLAI